MVAVEPSGMFQKGYIALSPWNLDLFESCLGSMDWSFARISAKVAIVLCLLCMPMFYAIVWDNFIPMP